LASGGLLTVVFITLKLVHKVTWPWWWVLSPLWLTVGLAVVIFLRIVAADARAGMRERRGARR
jgi:hypothetical protein